MTNSFNFPSKLQQEFLEDMGYIETVSGEFTHPDTDYSMPLEDCIEYEESAFFSWFDEEVEQC